MWNIMRATAINCSYLNPKRGLIRSHLVIPKAYISVWVSLSLKLGDESNTSRSFGLLIT